MEVRPAGARHRDGWDRLHAGRAGFDGVARGPAMRDRPWSRRTDPARDGAGPVAGEGGRMIGLAHPRAYRRPPCDRMDAATPGAACDKEP